MARIFEMDPNRVRDLPDETGGEEEDESTTFEVIEEDEDDEEELDLDDDDDEETIDTVDWVSNRNRSRARWDLQMVPPEDFGRRFILPTDEEYDEAS